MPRTLEAAMKALSQMSAMVAYWDSEQKCIYSNDAYRDWFGRSPDEMLGMQLRELLGEELYAKNLPYITAALAGQRQVFNRRITVPDGSIRDSVATYAPDVVDGIVRGFTVHVAEVTPLTVGTPNGDQALPICAWCKSVSDSMGNWDDVEHYLREKHGIETTHGICPDCTARLMSESN